ncbi:MAG: dihydrodipicolinate synthase family protein [Acutalibacteraceae bacterium]
MKKRSFERFFGMMPILPTPLDENDNIDTEDIFSLVDYCLSAGCKAIGHLAGASEYQMCSKEDREIIIKATVSATAGRVPVFIGTAANSIRDTIYNTMLAESLGADMIMLCSPPIGKADAEEIRVYYEKVCERTKLPVIVQDTGNSSAVFTPEFLVSLYNNIENIGYVKAEGGYWQEKLYRLTKIAPEEMQIIGGAAGKNMPLMLKLGITAFMTGTEAQEIHNAVVQAYLSGDKDRSTHLYYTTLLPYLELYTSTSYHKSLKHMLKRRSIIKTDRLLFPGREKELISNFVLEELDKVLDMIDKGAI